MEQSHIQHWFDHRPTCICKAFATKNEYSRAKSALLENLESLIAFRRREKIQDFSGEADFGLPLIYKLGEDSIGGKGRGLAFLNVVLNRYGSISDKYPLLRINVPVAVVLATGCFDEFIAHNPTLKDVEQWDDYADVDIDAMFLEASMPQSLLEQLDQVITLADFPLAIRSSSVLEDHITNPFAGVFRTYMLPNSHPDRGLRLAQLMTAIKLVYASMFLEGARVYRESLKIPSREEKMAVIIQKVAGSKHGEYFYPLVSGVAQSYNYYPGTGMQHADGIVTLSAGLGKNAVERGRTFAFCPLYPNKDLFPTTDIVKNAQRHFFALREQNATCVISSDEAAYLARVPIDANLLSSEMELLSSVWDHNDLEFLSGRFIKGPRVITYRNILHYKAFPLAELLNDLLKLARELLVAKQKWIRIRC